MKLIWLSDLHLDFLPSIALCQAFIREVAQEKPDSVLVTGDIADARLLDFYLELLDKTLPCPVYFVLGNHHFYKGSFVGIDAVMTSTTRSHPDLVELGHGEIISLGSNTALIGHRGWADGRAGLGSRSKVRLNDHHYIDDLSGLDARTLFAKLNRLGDESAEYVRQFATKALEQKKHLVIATHVPPFPEAALYEGHLSDPQHAPHFANVAMGQAILEVAREHPDKTITVFCGHTHHEADYSPAPNVKVRVAGAEYHQPKIAGVLMFP